MHAWKCIQFIIVLIFIFRFRIESYVPIHPLYRTCIAPKNTQVLYLAGCFILLFIPYLVAQNFVTTLHTDVGFIALTTI